MNKMTIKSERVLKMVRVFEDIYESAQKHGLIVKACGSFAVFMTASTLNDLSVQSKFSEHFFKENYQPPRDLDLISVYEQKVDIESLILSLGFKKNGTLETIPGIKRSLFSKDDIKIDVFYDVFDFNHLIDLTLPIQKPVGLEGKKRSIDRPGMCVTRTEQLLQKLQIVETSTKDLIDAWWLLSISDVKVQSDGATDAIFIDVIQYYTCRSWGFFYTLTTNLGRLKDLIEKHTDPSSIDLQKLVECRINDILTAIDRVPKSLSWKLRALAGPRLKWYQDVDDL